MCFFFCCRTHNSITLKECCYCKINMAKTGLKFNNYSCQSYIVAMNL